MAPHMADPGNMYFTAVYWACMTITTIGYGDIPVTSPGERAVATLAMLLGASVYAYVIGNICGIVASMDEATAEFHQNMNQLNEYMEEYKLPKDLRYRLREYFHHVRVCVWWCL